jgi:hypothetical protein
VARQPLSDVSAAHFATDRVAGARHSSDLTMPQGDQMIHGRGASGFVVGQETIHLDVLDIAVEQDDRHAGREELGYHRGGRCGRGEDDPVDRPTPNWVEIRPALWWQRALWDVERKGLPMDDEIELLVESKGRLQGRFMLSAAPDTHPSMDQRLVAVTLAAQVGASLR